MADSDALTTFARRTLPIAAGSAILAGLAGLVAQQEVKVEGEAHDLLITHRNLNLGVIAVATALAAWRQRRATPGAGYLALGLATLGVMGYTAYLGGHMVYEHGVGVQPAGGVRGPVPELVPAQAGAVARAIGSDLVHGTEHTIEHLAEGEIAPALTHRADQAR